VVTRVPRRCRRERRGPESPYVVNSAPITGRASYPEQAAGNYLAAGIVTSSVEPIAGKPKSKITI
jgi:hypothetical protein